MGELYGRWIISSIKLLKNKKKALILRVNDPFVNKWIKDSF